MRYASAALRGVLVAPKGRKLVVADLANIEVRMLAWLAGERWKLDAFAAFDRGEGSDLYRITAGHILGVPAAQVSKAQRDVMGKVPELALGYEGGVGAFRQFSQGYGIDMAQYWPTIQQGLAPLFVRQAQDHWDQWGRHRERNQGVAVISQGALHHAWLASEDIKLAWRDRHPATCLLWRYCQDAARYALHNPGSVVEAGPRLRFKAVQYQGHPWLRMALPSGREVVYFRPRIGPGGAFSYEATDSGQGPAGWGRLLTYGGKLVENACQSCARDILADRLQAVENAGYRVVLTVHDEMVAEAPDTTDYSGAHLSALLATNPDWANGLPLAAEGFEAQRYRKG